MANDLKPISTSQSAQATLREVSASELRVIAGSVAPGLRAARLQAEAVAARRAQVVAAPESHPASPIEELRRNDQGPAVQRARGRLEVVDAVDPESGTLTRRARLRDPLRRMVLRRELPYRCYVAADQFRADLERADGGQDPTETLSLISGPGANAPWLRQNAGAPGQWAAMERVKAAWAVVGLIALNVFSWTVLNRGALTDYDQVRGDDRGTGARTLRAALTRLADHYDLGDLQHPPGWS